MCVVLYKEIYIAWHSKSWNVSVYTLEVLRQSHKHCRRPTYSVTPWKKSTRPAFRQPPQSCLDSPPHPCTCQSIFVIIPTLIIHHFFTFCLPRDAMYKRGLCSHAVSVCLSVCLRVCVTFVSCVETSNRIVILFTTSGGHTILVFLHQTGRQYSDGDPLTGVSNARGYEKTRFSTNISLYL